MYTRVGAFTPDRRFSLTKWLTEIGIIGAEVDGGLDHTDVADDIFSPPNLAEVFTRGFLVVPGPANYPFEFGVGTNRGPSIEIATLEVVNGFTPLSIRVVSTIRRLFGGIEDNTDTAALPTVLNIYAKRAGVVRAPILSAPLTLSGGLSPYTLTSDLTVATIPGIACGRLGDNTTLEFEVAVDEEVGAAAGTVRVDAFMVLIEAAFDHRRIV